MTRRRKRRPTAKELDAITQHALQKRVPELLVLTDRLRKRALNGERVDLYALARLEQLSQEAALAAPREEDGPKRVIVDIIESTGEARLRDHIEALEAKLRECGADVPARPRDVRPPDRSAAPGDRTGAGGVERLRFSEA